MNSMKVALLTPLQGMIRGGAELFYDGLEAALRSTVAEVQRINVPLDESSFEAIVQGYRHVRNLDLSKYDVVISTKSPTYNISHPRHILYLVHTVRVFYDMFDTWTDGTALSKMQRDLLREMDFQAISRIPEERRFAIGHEVAERLHKHLGLFAQAVHPALPDGECFHSGEPKYFFHPGRLHPWKRLDLVLDAFRLIRQNVELLITGQGEAEEALKVRAAGDPRIRFLGDVPRAELYTLYSRAIAVPFVPVREDYGYVAVEAMMSSVPVITAVDSGEPSRIVTHRKTGWIVKPAATDIATALEEILSRPETAKEMGKAGRKSVEKNTWPNVVQKLLLSVRSQSTSAKEFVPAGNRFPGVCRLLIVDNQPIDPPVGGGRLRLWGLYSNLPKSIEPTYVGTYDWPGEQYRAVTHNDKLLEVTVPQSVAHFAAHESLRKQDPALTMDVTFPLLSVLSSGYRERVKFEASRCDAIIVSHPWVWPLLATTKSIQNKPIFYDAHNAEGVLRRSFLHDGAIAQGVADMIEGLERELCERAEAIFTCSEEDAETFVRLYQVHAAKIHVIPNGVNTKEIRPASPDEKRHARRVLGLSAESMVAIFIGSAYKPNVDAARYICDELAATCSEIIFLIVGGCSGGLQQRPVPSNVMILGAVEDGRRNLAYHASDFAINPMTQGSGTNIKMMDFMAAGLPTVTTPIGMRGLSDARETFLTADLANFPAVIERLIGDRGLKNHLAITARATGETHYDWKQISKKLALVVQQTVRTKLVVRESKPEPRLAVMSSWNTHCGIADYSRFLLNSLRTSVPWMVYAENRTCGETLDSRVVRNWEIGLEDLTQFETSIQKDRIQLLLIQYNPAFFDEMQLISLLRMAREQDVRTAITFHALTSVRICPLLQENLRTTDRLFVHRQSDVELLNSKGLDQNVRRIPHGIPRVARRSVSAVQKELGMEDSFVVGHFGFIRPHKGTLELIEGFEILARENARARLLLLCSEYPFYDSKNYLELCRERIADSAFKDRIHISSDHLPMRTVIRLLQACNVIVYPYKNSDESSSAAVRFGIAAGRPVLVSSSTIFEELREVATVADCTSGDTIAMNLLWSSRHPQALLECQKKIEKFAAAHDWARAASLIWGHLKHAMFSNS